jgi:phosphoribosylanthranilate isomerase
MLVQIYEVTSPEEASALAEIGVDHIGVLVGEGEFPREQPIKVAKRIFSTIAPSCRGSALSLSANLDTIEGIILLRLQSCTLEHQLTCFCQSTFCD